MNWQDARATLLRELITKPRLGVVTDLDGTISAIAPIPAEANITPRTRTLLEALGECLPVVAVVTGRGVEDARNRVGLPGLVYVGNHGLERWVDGGAEVAPEARAYRPALEAAQDEVNDLIEPGMTLEDKFATASIHYRQVADPLALRERLAPILSDIARRHGLKMFEGRRIFELRPPIDVDKGTAFRRLVEEYRLDGAVFMGDDITDVDGMRMARALRESGACYALAVGVESPGTPDAVRETADIVCDGVGGVESFLDWLFNARCASAS